MNIKEALSFAAKKYKSNKQKTKAIAGDKPKEAMASFLSARYYKDRVPKSPDRVKARSGIKDWKEELGIVLLEGSLGQRKVKRLGAAHDKAFNNFKAGKGSLYKSIDVGTDAVRKLIKFNKKKRFKKAEKEKVDEGSLSLKRLIRKKADPFKLLARASNKDKILLSNPKKMKFIKTFDETPVHPVSAKVKK